MSRTVEEQAAWERQCYGCLAADFKRSIEGSLPVKLERAHGSTPRIAPPGYLDRSRGYGMCAMSILSDAQEMIEHGDPEGARQAINRAKLLIADYWMKGD